MTISNVTKLLKETKDMQAFGDNECVMIYRIVPLITELPAPDLTPDDEAIELVVFRSGDMRINPGKGSRDESDESVEYFYPSQVRAIQDCLRECGFGA